MFNHQSLNPGYAGSKEYTNFTILHHSQWLNFDGAPESQAFTFNHKMTSKNIGFGISGVNDKIGPMTSSRVALDLAYHLALKNLFYQLASKLGVVNYDFDQAIIRTTDVGDNSFVFDGEGEFKSNIGLEFITIDQNGMRDFQFHGLLKMKVLTYKDIIIGILDA